jgi:hypothetical protein
MQRRIFLLPAVIVWSLWGFPSCATRHEVEVKPVEIKPIHITADVVGRRRALQIAENAKPGEWLQDAGGKWVQK